MNIRRPSIILVATASTILAVTTAMVVVGCDRSAQRAVTTTVVDQDGRPVVDMPVACIPSVAVTRLSFSSGPASIGGPLPFKTSYNERDPIQLSTGLDGSVSWIGQADHITWRLGRRPGFLPISSEAWKTQGDVIALVDTPANYHHTNFRIWRLSDPASMPILTSLKAESTLLPLPAWTTVRWLARADIKPAAILIRCAHQDGAWTIYLRGPQPGLLSLDPKHLGAVPAQGYHQELILRSPSTNPAHKRLQLPTIVSRVNLVEAPFRVYTMVKIEIDVSINPHIARIRARADITGGNCLFEPSWGWRLQETASLSIDYSDPLPPALAARRAEAAPKEAPLPIDGWIDFTKEIAKTAEGWIIYARRTK